MESTKRILIQFEQCEKKLVDCVGQAANSDAAADTVSCLVQELEGCVRTLGTLSPPPPPAVLLTTVRSVFKFCQCGEDNRNSIFEALSHQLGSLFKTTYSLLKGCLDSIEQNVNMTGLDILLPEITAVASLSLHFDPSLLVLCWRSIGKLVCGSEDKMEVYSVIQEVVEQLCIAIRTTTQQSVVEGDPLLDKRLKSGRFLSSLLLRLLAHYPIAVVESGKVTFDLLLSAHQTVLAVESEELRFRLQSNLILLYEPLIECTSKNQHFLQLLLDVSNVSSDQYCGWGLCLAALLKHFSSLPEGLQRYCLEVVSSREEASTSCRVLECVFTCLEHCWLTRAMSSKWYRGQQTLQLIALIIKGYLSSVSFYEWMYCHFCALVVCLPDHFLQNVERSLITHLLAPQTFSVQLASDCLIFVARVGGDSLTMTYCQLVMDLLISVPLTVASHSSSVLWLAALFNRLLGLLSSPSQISVLSSHDCHSWLWAVVWSQALHSHTANTLQSGLLSEAINLLMEPANVANPSLDKMGPSLNCLQVLLQHPILPTSKDEVGRLPNLLIPLLQQQWCLYCPELSIGLLSSFLPDLSPPDIAKVLAKLSELVKSSRSFSLTLAVCSILHQFACEHCTMLDAHLSLLCECYYSLLCCGHWLVRHRILEAFRAFAEVAPHESAVELCVPPSLTDIVVGYIHKIPYKEEMCKTELLHGVVLLASSNRLLTLSGNREEAAALRQLKVAWEKIQTFERPSTDFIEQLYPISVSISSFLAQYTNQNIKI